MRLLGGEVGRSYHHRGTSELKWSHPVERTGRAVSIAMIGKMSGCKYLAKNMIR